MTQSRSPKNAPPITTRSNEQVERDKTRIQVEHFHNNLGATFIQLIPSIHPGHDRCNIVQFTSLFHMFLLATRHRVRGLDSQLSESNLPRTHTVVRLRFKGKEAETSYPQTVVHQ